MSRRLLSPGSLFIGNDSDLSANWIFRLKFSRLWTAAGDSPWWNPFGLLGTSHLAGPEQPYSLINLCQRVFTDPNKGLDHTLVALTAVAALSMAALCIRIRFSPLASLLAGIALAGTGTCAMQLFAGHVGLYGCLCLSPLYCLLLLQGVASSRVWSLFPAALTLAAILSAGDPQGAYIAVWTAQLFLFLRVLLGNPQKIHGPTLWTHLPREERPGDLVSSLSWRERGRESGWFLLRLILVWLWGAALASLQWIPQLASTPWLDSPPADLFPHSAPPLAWLTIFIPHFFLGPGQTYNWAGWAGWEGQPGIGCSCLLVAALGIALRRSRGLLLPGLLLVFSALLAAGKYTPAFAIYAHLDPWIACFEVPSRMYFATNFASVVLVAWGIDSLLQCNFSLSPSQRLALKRVSGALAGCWCVSLFLDGNFEVWQYFLRHVQFGYDYGGMEAVDPVKYYVLLWSRFSAACLLAGALLYAWLRLPHSKRLAATVLLVLLDVTRFGYPLANLRPIQDFSLPEAIHQLIQEKKFDRKAVNFAFPQATGDLALHLSSEWNIPWLEQDPEGSLITRSSIAAWGKDAFPQVLEHPGPLTKFFGVGVYLHSQEMLQHSSLQTLYAGTSTYAAAGEDWAVVHDEQARPPVYLSRAAEPCPNYSRMFRRLKEQPVLFTSNMNFLDPASYRNLVAAVREQGLNQPFVRSREAQEKAWVQEILPGSLTIGCELLNPAVLVVNQRWTEDWSVSVDGFEKPCLPCQLGLNRGVLVEGGQHVVRFSYRSKIVERSRSFSWAALVVSILAGLGLAGLQLIRKRFFEAV